MGRVTFWEPFKLYIVKLETLTLTIPAVGLRLLHEIVIAELMGDVEVGRNGRSSGAGWNGRPTKGRTKL